MSPQRSPQRPPNYRGAPPPRRKKKQGFDVRFLALVASLLAVSVGLVLLVVFLLSGPNGPKPDDGFLGIGSDTHQVGTPNPGQPDEPTPIPTLEPTPTPAIPNPYAVDGTRPSDFGLQTAMQLNGQSISSYQRTNPIDFGETNHYTDVDGIVTFRGNNFRDTAAYGTVGQSIEGKLNIVWKTDMPERIARVNSDRSWFGIGWTGQPLFIRWDKDVRAKMNMHESKRNEDDLVEVIFGTEGAAIYFLDLKDGKPTRDKIIERWTFKGAGAIDPRGYPLFYLGAGDQSKAGRGQNLIYSLTDTKLLYEYGQDDPFRDRSWVAYDPSTIVHAGTDSVTYASETNIIYQFTLNTRYDREAGTVSIAPSDIFKWKYTTDRSRAAYKDDKDPDNTKPYLGFESSPVFWREYMYVADNCGNLFCININTFETIWMSDVLDDTNCSPVFELDPANGRAYIYIGTSARFTRNPSTNVAQVPFWKIDAITGEKIWTAGPIPCSRPADSGGIQDTAALGKHQLSDLVFVTFANVIGDRGSSEGSWLIAYDKATGHEAWRQNFGGQCWSSPVDVYDDAGRGYIVYASASYTKDGEPVGGFVTLLDGRTGAKLDVVEIKGHVEASPAVYGNMIVVGTRGQVMYGISIS
ncbi:MAG: pyrrolo-quinoline quinone [Clostridiales bacterium]|nr:pyrrolo-quinoline quinone [Clostridiales bacterium]